VTTNYWTQLAGRRMQRRRLLIASGAASTLMGLGLVGCGSDSGGSNSTSDTSSSLLSKPEDSSSRAKPGGVLRSMLASDPPNFDPLLGGSSIVVSSGANYTYPRLLKYTTARFPKAAPGDSEGDLAESFELSPDKLTMTFRLRQGLKWDPKAPTSGRAIDASDVVFSWNKFAKASALRGDIAYTQATPFAPVESITSPDPRTAVFKLHAPDQSIIGLFTSPRHLSIMPKESDGGFDPKVDLRGYGPYLLDEFRPSAALNWRKNPDYYVKGRPYPDRIENPILTEYSAQLAQFRAGSIYTSVAQQADILPTKQDVPETLLRQDRAWPLSHNGFKFGYEGNSPFKDQRMRQAANLLVDNDTFGEVFAESERFKKAGLDVTVRYNSIVAPGFEGFWLDPQDEKAFGPNAKFMKYDIAEAKKLMSAAGFAGGVDTSFWYSSTRLPPSYTKASQILSQMLTEGGIRAKLAPIDNYDDFINNYLYAYTAGNQKGFNGIWYVMENLSPTCVSYLFAVCHKDGGRFQGMSPDGSRAWLGDPQTNSMIEKMKQEFDNKRLQDMVHDFTRYFHGQAYRKVNAWATQPFSLVWPVLGNWGVDQTFTGGNPQVEANINVWIDDSKPPIKRS